MENQFPTPYIINQNIKLTLPLYLFNLSSEIDIENLIDKIKTLRTKYPKSTRTNLVTNNGWRSPYFNLTNVNEIEMFRDITAIIQKKLQTINSFDVKLNDLWTAIYSNDDYATKHNHFSLWADIAYNTVLYLTDTKTPILFDNCNPEFQILPKKGDLLVMHPLTYHSVPNVNDQSERIVFVCNFSK